MHVDFCTDIMSLVQNYHNNFKQPVRSFRIRLHTDKAAFISPWVDGSLHLWVTASELCGIHHVYLFLFSRLRSSYTSDVFFWKIFSRECDYLCAALSFPDLYPSASASFYWNTLTNCPFHPCITQPLSILLCELLNCFSYLADWFWLALLSLGSLTGWRRAAVCTIAVKLVNLKCPGI